MAASEGTAKQWQQATGCPMIEGWGMSETCAIGTNNTVTSTQFTGTIGLPLPGIEIAIKDDDGRSLPLGQPGEICIKGPMSCPAITTSRPRTRRLYRRRLYAHRRHRRHG